MMIWFCEPIFAQMLRMKSGPSTNDAITSSRFTHLMIWKIFGAITKVTKAFSAPLVVHRSLKNFFQKFRGEKEGVSGNGHIHR